MWLQSETPKKQADVSGTQLNNKNKRNFMARTVQVEANIPRHPLEMRSVANDYKLYNSVENSWIFFVALRSSFVKIAMRFIAWR